MGAGLGATLKRGRLGRLGTSLGTSLETRGLIWKLIWELWWNNCGRLIIAAPTVVSLTVVSDCCGADYCRPAIDRIDGANGLPKKLWVRGLRVVIFLRKPLKGGYRGNVKNLKIEGGLWGRGLLSDSNNMVKCSPYDRCKVCAGDGGYSKP